MHVEEVHLHDLILVKLPDREKPINCRVTSINTDNVITAAFYEGDVENGLKEKEFRVNDEWIKGVEAYPFRDADGRRVIIYCKD